MDEWVNPQVKPEVDSIKHKIAELGWTTNRQPDHPLNHGPLHTRVQVESLYRRWNELINPWGFKRENIDVSRRNIE